MKSYSKIIIGSAIGIVVLALVAFGTSISNDNGDDVVVTMWYVPVSISHSHHPKRS